MDNNLTILIDKYLNGAANESEREVVDSWYQSFETNPGLTDQLSPEETVKAMAASFALISGRLDLH